MAYKTARKLTTEYRKMFKWFPLEKRQAIWEENFKYRKQRRMQEFRHEPFFWKSGTSECESPVEEDPLPPSKLRLHHLELIGQAFEKQVEDFNDVSYGQKFLSKEVQTEHYIFLRDKEVQTDIKDAAEEIQEESHESTFLDIEKSQVHPKSRVVKKLHLNVPSSEIAKGSTGSPVPFDAYGRGYSSQTTSGKITYNVKASNKEVHPSALRAIGNQKSHSKVPSSKAVRQPMKFGSPGSPSHHDSSSWISEYRSRFKSG